MSSKVTVKYGKKKHKNVEIKATDSLEDIQAVIFSLTQVMPERQKIIIKGKTLQSDADVAKLIKNKVVMTVMGSSASATSTVPASGGKKIKFVEEMTAAERQEANTELPPGLNNLGNTCYLNSCIQCMKSVDELKVQLKRYAVAHANDNSMATKLGKLMTLLESHSDAVTPSEFVQYFRGAFPRFASRGENGMWEQQDADEAYTEILSALRSDASFVVANTDSDSDSEEKVNVVDSLFKGAFGVQTVCAESEEEPKLNVSEAFVKLQCFIDINTRHISDGIKKSMSSVVEKRSSVLGRNASWTSTKAVSALPKYLAVQLVRFFWKTDKKKNAKILRRVVFPDKLDVHPFCDDTLKKGIEEYRRRLTLKEDKEREERQAVQAKAEADKAADKGKEQTNEKKKEEDTAASATATESTAEADADAMEVDEEKKEEKEEFSLSTGYYELCGIVTHKGRSANSGHYIGYSKDTARNQWMKYDDEETTEIKEDDIKQLYGGGDFQMAFLCLFRRIEMRKLD